MVVVWAAAAVGIGTAVGWGRGALGFPAAVAGLAAIVAAVLVRRRALWFAVVALCYAACASAAWRTAAQADAVLPTLSERVVEVCGSARELGPRSVVLRAERVETRTRAWTVSEPVRVVHEDVRRVRPGERVCARGEVVAPRAPTDPPLLVADDLRAGEVSSRIRVAASTVRASFSRVAQDALPPTQAGLLLGMTDGDVALLDERTVETFRTTGLAHLVAVSGSNVAVVIVVVMLVVRRLFPRRRWMHAAFALPCLVFFAFLTGLEASVLRAVVTASIALVVTVDGRTTDAIRLAAFAFVVLVGASPELLFHPGFQLSFAATVGLILWARPLTESIARRLPSGRIWLAVAASVGTTVAAQAAAAPLLALHFGRIPAVGGIANLLVAPLAPVVMIGGVVVLGVAALVPPLASAPVLMRLLLDAILWASRVFSGLPSASIDAGVLVGVAMCAGLVAYVARSRAVRSGAMAVALVAICATGGGALGAHRCDGGSVVALDVGQGTAVLLRAGGHAVLVDGGPDDGRVVDDLDAHGVAHLDAVFISHPHADHVQGVVDVLERLDAGAIIAPVTLGWGSGAAVVAAAEDARVPVRHAAAGDAFDFGDALRIEVVHPQPVDEPPIHEENNVHAFSLVLRAEVEGASVLLPGDVGAEEEKELLDPEVVGSSILVAPHHGSKDLDPAFIEAVDPRVVLVTVGEDNRYGHPATEAMRAYDAHAAVFRTDTQGAIAVCAADGSLQVVTESR